MQTILIAVLVFGFLIFIHEFGHYIFGRIFNVTITEFSIGMGPKLVWYDSKKTGIKYAISAIPFGGYVAMVGEDGDSEDPNAFGKKPAWQRLIIIVAGATVNIVAGILALVIFASITNIGGTKIHDFYRNIYEVSSHDTGLLIGDEIVRIGDLDIKSSSDISSAVSNNGDSLIGVTVIRDGKEVIIEAVRFPVIENKSGEKSGLVDFQLDKSGKISLFYKEIYATSSYDSGIRAGDQVIRVDGKRVRNLDALSYEIMRKGHEPVDITVLRDGKEVHLENVVFPVIEEQGQRFGMMDFQVYRTEKNLFKVIGYSFSKAALIVRMCWESIIDLITGRYTVAAVSGPIGIGEAIGNAAGQGIAPLLSITALISINLGVMNLLPIPALDGGRTVLILAEMISKKKLPPELEAKINAVSLAVLLGLSAIIMIKDVIGLFN